MDIAFCEKELVTMSLKEKIYKLLHRAEVNRAVFFGFLSKICSSLAGAVAMLLIVTKFSPELQGYYYTFSSLLGLQIFVELGFGTVIIQFASHEWSKLQLNSDGFITGDAQALSRLKSLAQLAFKWYFVAGLALTIFLGIGGYCFFIHSSNVMISWKLPWLILSVVTGISIVLMPVWSLLEGCNQVSSVYKFRFIQGLFGNFAVWIAILSGAKLWTPAVLSIVVSGVALVFFISKYKNFIKSLITLRPEGQLIRWRSEIFPMQWKIALSWCSGYFMFGLFTPVLFNYYGPVIAGRMGLAINVISLVSFISISWTLPRVPTFGILINRKQFDSLDKMFWKISRAVFLMSTAASLIIFAGVYILYATANPLSERILGPLPIAVLLLATLVNGMSVPMSYYLIAHKQMPTLNVSITAGVLMVISTLILGKYYSATGIACGYLVVVSIAFLWIIAIWRDCRRNWHAQAHISQDVNFSL